MLISPEFFKPYTAVQAILDLSLFLLFKVELKLGCQSYFVDFPKMSE